MHQGESRKLGKKIPVMALTSNHPDPTPTWVALEMWGVGLLPAHIRRSKMGSLSKVCGSDTTEVLAERSGLRCVAFPASLEPPVLTRGCKICATWQPPARTLVGSWSWKEDSTMFRHLQISSKWWCHVTRLCLHVPEHQVPPVKSQWSTVVSHAAPWIPDMPWKTHSGISAPATGEGVQVFPTKLREDLRRWWQIPDLTKMRWRK